MGLLAASKNRNTKIMNAQELRIGNYLEFSNGIQPSKIITVGRRFFSSAAIEKEDGDFDVTPYYNPIPLSPEILEKAGFVKDENIQQDFSYILKAKSRITFVYYKGDKSCFSIEQDGKLIDLALGAVKYLHQLQNLYWCLVGEELTINF